MRFAAGQDGPGKSNGHRGPGGEVPGTTDDLARFRLAHIDTAKLQAVGVRVLACLDDLPDKEAAEISVIVGDPSAADPLDFERRRGETLHDTVVYTRENFLGSNAFGK